MHYIVTLDHVSGESLTIQFLDFDAAHAFCMGCKEALRTLSEIVGYSLIEVNHDEGTDSVLFENSR